VGTETLHDAGRGGGRRFVGEEGSPPGLEPGALLASIDRFPRRRRRWRWRTTDAVRPIWRTQASFRPPLLLLIQTYTVVYIVLKRIPLYLPVRVCMNCVQICLRVYTHCLI